MNSIQPITFQTEVKYKSVPYGQGTIYSSACGPASLCNALRAAGIANISLPVMCALAERCGARVSGGTSMKPLLKAAGEKYHFTYETTDKNLLLLRHLQQGGTAILHAGSSYPLFSTSGHFVAAVGVSGETVTIADSYWYAGKYTASAIRRNYVSVVEKGLIRTGLTQCGKATADRSPSYYLISKIVPTQEGDMIYYETLKEIPEAYRPSIQKLIETGALLGKGSNKLHLSEDMCRVLTIIDRSRS